LLRSPQRSRPGSNVLFSDNSFWLIGVQVLDGVGAGIFGALTPLVIADIMRGTGRYNLAQGAIATAQGIGASSSGLAAGVIVDHFGYSAAFLAAGAAAAVALAVFALWMPETADRETVPAASLNTVPPRRRDLSPQSLRLLSGLMPPA
jgi:MFS family permease